MSSAEWDESALDSTIRVTLRDVRALPVESAMRRLHGLSRLVEQRGETAERRALITQAYRDLARRSDDTPSAAELAAWVGAS